MEPTSSGLVLHSLCPGCTVHLFQTQRMWLKDISPLSELVEDTPKAETVDSEFLPLLVHLRRQQKTRKG